MSRPFIRIATWNIGRKSHLLVLEKLWDVKADIWFLTETHRDMIPGEPNRAPFSGYVGLASEPEDHKRYPGQNKVTIWSRYGIRRSVRTFDPDTVCAEIETPLGPMIVYGLIISFFGATDEEFPKQWQRHFHEIDKHVEDWSRIANHFPDHLLCIAGDFNQNWDGVKWGNHKKNCEAVEKLSKHLPQLKVDCAARQDIQIEKKIPRANIDQIFLSNRIMHKVLPEYQAWYFQVTKRDDLHNGIAIDIRISLVTASACCLAPPMWRGLRKCC